VLALKKTPPQKINFFDLGQSRTGQWPVISTTSTTAHAVKQQK